MFGELDGAEVSAGRREHPHATRTGRKQVAVRGELETVRQAAVFVCGDIGKHLAVTRRAGRVYVIALLAAVLTVIFTGLWL